MWSFFFFFMTVLQRDCHRGAHIFIHAFAAPNLMIRNAHTETRGILSHTPHSAASFWLSSKSDRRSRRKKSMLSLLFTSEDAAHL